MKKISNTTVMKAAFYVPIKFYDRWRQIIWPGKNYSVNVSGAMLVWLTLPAEVREAAIKLSYDDDIEKSIQTIKTHIKKLR